MGIILAGSAWAQTGTTIGGEATAAQAEKICFEQKTKKCCDVVGATLKILCSLDGFDWYCTSTPSANDQVKVAEEANEGYRLRQHTNQVSECNYKKPRCGDAVGECHLDNQPTEEECKESLVAGAECTSGSRALSEDGHCG